MAPHKKPGITRARATKYIKTKRSTEQTIDVGEGLNEAPEGEIRPAEPPKKKGRGPGRIKAVKDAPDERPEVWQVGHHEFSCKTQPKLITATITRIALGLMPAPVRSFHSFTDDAKKSLQIEFLVPSPTTQPSQELPMGLQMDFNQEAGGSSQPNQNGSFQALLSQEIVGNDAAMTNWWANQPST